MISRLSTRVSTMIDFVVDDGEIGGFAGLATQIWNSLRHDIAATGEGRSHREALGADMPLRLSAVEPDEAVLFQGRQ